MDNLLYFDIESTGLEIHKEKIITISFIFNDKEKTLYINPNKPIPESASRIHGIKDDDVKDWKPFKEYAGQIYELLNKCDGYVGYNIRKYDVPLLAMELLRCGYDLPNKTIIDVYEVCEGLFRSLKLKDLYLTLSGNILENAHDSSSDIRATKELYEIVKKKYLYEK